MAIAQKGAETNKAKIAIGASIEALTRLSGIRHPLAAPVLLYFIAVLLPVGANLGPIHLTGVRFVLLIFIIPLSIQLFIGKYGKVLITDVLFALHVIWIWVALFNNNPNQAIANAGSTTLEFWGGYVLARAFIRSKEDFIAVIRLIVFVMLCTTPFAIYELLTGNSPILAALKAIPGNITIPDIDIGKRLGLNRVQLVFAHPIHFGLFCAIMFPMCWVGMRGVYRVNTRSAVSSIVGVSGFSALSSGAILAMIFQFGLIGWAWVTKTISRRWLILISIFVLAYITVGLISDRTPFQVFLTRATFSAHNAYVRVAIFDSGMDNVLANPITGIGLNDWERPAWLSESVDNFWLLTAMRYGVPGFLTLFVGYASIMWRIGRRNFNSDIVLWQFRRAWMFSFIGLSFALCTVHIWHTIYSFTFFMFGTGVWLLSAEPQSQDKDDEGDAEGASAEKQKYKRHFNRSFGGAQSSSGEVKKIYSRQGSVEKPSRKATPPQTMQGQHNIRGSMRSGASTKLKATFSRFENGKNRSSNECDDNIRARKSRKTTNHTRQTTRHRPRSDDTK